LHVFASLQEHLLQQLHLSTVRGDESNGRRLARRLVDTAITEQREDHVEGDDRLIAVRVRRSDRVFEAGDVNLKE
jgi:hypothetical protein